MSPELRNYLDLIYFYNEEAARESFLKYHAIDSELKELVAHKAEVDKTAETLRVGLLALISNVGWCDEVYEAGRDSQQAQIKAGIAGNALYYGSGFVEELQRELRSLEHG